jgi:hypothetical protein
MADQPINLTPTLHMLSTTDNPYNPFTHFDEWFAWDTQAGYNTAGLLARIINTSDELSEAQQDYAMEEAINEIIRENVSGMHMRVTQPAVAA